MFNRRRQSRDRVLIADLVRHVKENKLWVTPYSAPLFPQDMPRLIVTEDFSTAQKQDYCFVEDTDPAPLWNLAGEVIVYRWHRLYPADVRFTGDLSGFYLSESTEFVGSSHDKITKEVWKK